MKFRHIAGLAVLGCTGISTAWATPSEIPEACDAQEAQQTMVMMGQFNSDRCIDGVAGGVFSTEGTRNTVSTLTNDLRSGQSDESTAFLGESNMQGLAAGNHLAGWGFWATASYLNYDGDNNLEANTVTPLAKVIYDADTASVLFGADRLFYDRLVLGVAGGYEDTDVFTFFNGGNTESDGFTVAPYMAYLINDTFSVDAAFGYSSLENDTDRLEIGTGSTLTADFDSDRLFFSTNINANTTYNDWYLSGRVGYLYSHESQDGYTETGSTGGGGNRTVGERDVHISQIIVGGEAAYNFGKQEAYFGAAYVNDLSRGIGRNAGGLPGGVAPDFDDDDEIQLNAGVRMYWTRLTAIVDLTHTVTRNNFDNTGVMFTLRTDL